METEQAYTFEVQLSDRHEKLMSSGRWSDAVKAAIKAGEYLRFCAENGFTEATIKLRMVEEYNLID